MVKQRANLKFYLTMLIFAMLFGCIAINEDNSTPQDSGELALKINWDMSGFDSSMSQEDQFDCKGSGIETVEVTVYDQSGNMLLPPESWDCKAHQGSIKGLPSGQVNVLLLAKNSNREVVFRGMEKGVTVASGKTKKAKINAYLFIPKPLSPTNMRCSSSSKLTWQGVDGAQSYQVRISKNENMEPYDVFPNIKNTFIKIPNIEKNTLYFWKIMAIDLHENISQSSEVQRFTTNNKILLKDIGIGSSDSDPKNFTVIGNWIYFSANGTEKDPITKKIKKLGNELWKTSGTTPGTELLKDINPGESGSEPKNLIKLKTKMNTELLLFSANNGVDNEELWISDGSTDGTYMLKDIKDTNQVSIDKYFKGFTYFKDHIYYLIDYNEYGIDLWRTDGTEPGTKKFQTILTDGRDKKTSKLLNINSERNIKNSDNYLFFCSSDDVHGYELWRTDGEVSGTIMLKDINAGGNGSSPREFTVLNNTLFFVAEPDGNKDSLWISDGTPNGTILVKTLIETQERITSLTPANNLIFFFIETLRGNNQYFHELWISDGTTQGTTFVKDLQNTGKNIFVGDTISFSGQLFFTLYNKKNNYELWKSNGTLEGTINLKEINNELSGICPSSLSVVNNFLYFNADDGKSGTELWRSDGTANNTHMIKDISPGTFSGNPEGFTSIGTKSYIFSANDGKNGNELWISSGGDQDIKLLKDINNIKIDESPSYLSIFNNNLFFYVGNGISGGELWKSNGLHESTNLVKVISHLRGKNIHDITITKDAFYFFADNGDYKELWKSQGDADSTESIYYFENMTFKWPSNLTALNNLLFFSADHPFYGVELHVHDETALDNKTSIIEIAPDSKDSYPKSFTPVGNKLYFTADDKTTGRGLWVSEGTADNTNMIKKFLYQDFPIQNLVTMNNEFIYFIDGDNSTFGLWQLDTKSIKVSLVYALTGCEKLVSTGDRLFFLRKESTGYSIWTSDGTESGTKKIKSASQIKPYFSIPKVVTTDNGYFFLLYTETDTFELWFTNKKLEEPYLIKKNIENNGEYLNVMFAVKDRLFFRAYDKETGHELWETDGTTENTRLIWDIYEGDKDGKPQNFILFNEMLYFTAIDNKTGFEIRSICPDINNF